MFRSDTRYTEYKYIIYFRHKQICIYKMSFFFSKLLFKFRHRYANVSSLASPFVLLFKFLFVLNLKLTNFYKSYE